MLVAPVEITLRQSQEPNGVTSFDGEIGDDAGGVE